MGWEAANPNANAETVAWLVTANFGTKESASQKNKRAKPVGSALEFPGRVLLSRDAVGHSTIGAEGLNCRVRDGNGCFPFAMATGNLTRALRAKFPTN